MGPPEKPTARPVPRDKILPELEFIGHTCETEWHLWSGAARRYKDEGQ
jgi:hypothetical protein